MRRLYVSIVILLLVLAGCVQGTDAPGRNDWPDPPELPDNLYDYAFSMENQLYQMPVSYSQFTENGWLQPDQEDVHGRLYSTRAQSSLDYIGALEKDSHRLAIVYGSPLSGEPTISDIYWTRAQMEALQVRLAKGVTAATTAEELVKAYGAPVKVENLGDSCVYVYGDRPDYPLEKWCQRFAFDSQGELLGVYLFCLYPTVIPEDITIMGLDAENP